MEQQEAWFSQWWHELIIELPWRNEALKKDRPVQRVARKANGTVVNKIRRNHLANLQQRE